MCLAPATPPAIAAFWSSLDKPFPALNWAPPLENWMITGAFNSFAVYSTALIVFEPTTFTAGRANAFSLARLKIAWTSSPVATPGLILWLISIILND